MSKKSYLVENDDLSVAYSYERSTAIDRAKDLSRENYGTLMIVRHQARIHPDVICYDGIVYEACNIAEHGE